MLSSFLYNVIILALSACSVQAWNCWLPDAVAFDNVGMKPCNTTLADSSEGSACCDPRDSCSTSGLCLGRSGYVYRGGCTDSTFGTANCPSLCLKDPVLGSKYNRNTNVYACGTGGMFSTNFCCESFATPAQSCCESNFTFQGSGYAFRPGHDAELALLSSVSADTKTTTAAATRATVTTTMEGVVSAITTTDLSGKTITSSATSVATTVAVDSNNAISASSTSAAKSDSSDLGKAIGAGVGVPLGCLALGLLAFLFWREKRLEKMKATPAATNPDSIQPVDTWKYGYTVTARAANDETRIEKDAQERQRQAMQLDGRSVYATNLPGRHELMDNGRSQV
ncbi:hypothetical protein ACMFMG_008630 [Clarireedia jacksonii]